MKKSLQVKTKTEVKTNTTLRTAVGVALGGVLLIAAGFTISGLLTKEEVKYAKSHYPYQTLGYTPGYTQGYIPGAIPGYSVPGYIRGYGTFVKLTTPQFVKERMNWVMRFILGKL